MVGIGFLSNDEKQVYDWCIVKIPCQVVFNGRTHDSVVELDLDHLFNERDTSIRFKGYSQNGRALYIETNKMRTKPRDFKKQKINIYLNTLENNSSL